ncbi:F-box protein Pof9 [Schizosaccharomyces pombe]|uniref:F-box protein pof9 n=1 Tax=Schizosaccharomyces pombe (strain 972 / ATCC 24843) TaxID=284812 RepID=POF9_SCHPO|nr:F-box protein Pof9 [Schizosaccharomyces pombe]O74381.1 RecName: Full=F-box protein pof9 [Schizosaccharomyces pombe 972h-]BAB55638.1 F-box protein Pof9 [Schizosaccharomyces pombe]CAA20302.1 F-box protein Pof9 [Schizosaccharomyces pombe]|eukprot:NP_595769.1 F-box protein Pof9 [Schizosaccharomyces pombe]
MAKSPFLELSYDILLEISTYLDYKDIVHLSETCKSLSYVFDDKTIWHRFCARVQGLTNVVPVVDDNYKRPYAVWKDRGYAYSWGQQIRNYLGRVVNTNQYPRDRPGALTGKDVRSTIQVQVGGYGMYLLNENGNLYVTGVPNNVGPELMRDLEPIVKIHAGREFCLALGETGHLYQVSLKTRICLTDEQNMLSAYRGRIANFKSGWDSHSAYVPGIGFLVWHTGRESEAQLFQPEASMKEFVLNDYVHCAGFLVYTVASPQKKGAVFRLDLDQATQHTLGRELKRFASHDPHQGWHLAGSFETFTCLSDDGNTVYMGHANTKQVDDDPVIHDFLQNRGIKQLAHGDHHHLYLTSDHSIWSWGVELRYCGCLGLGSLHLQEQTSDPSIVSDPRTARNIVSIPHQIHFSGTCYSVAAGGWQSAALAISESVLPEVNVPPITTFSIIRPSRVPALRFLAAPATRTLERDG